MAETSSMLRLMFKATSGSVGFPTQLPTNVGTACQPPYNALKPVTRYNATFKPSNLLLNDVCNRPEDGNFKLLVEGLDVFLASLPVTTNQGHLFSRHPLALPG